MKTMIIPLILLVVSAIGLVYALGTAAGGIGKLLKKQPINRKNALAATISLVLALAMVVPAFMLWPSPAVDEPLVNAEGGFTITPDTPDVPMSGNRTNAQLDAFLKEGFGAEYDAVWNGDLAGEFMFAEDQNKIKANEAYLQAILNNKKITGFRNGVSFPSNVITPEVYKQLSSMTAEEREDVYNQHRWIDVYRHILGNPAYCEMILSGLEEYPEFIEQNSMWHPAFRQLLDGAKASEDGVYSLWAEETGGTGHWNDEFRYGAARVCAVLENAVIRGIAPDQESIENWELPSMSPDVNTRWTVKLTEKDDQENKPAVVWAFPNTKSGQDAYNDGINLADLRLEKFGPNQTIPTGTPDDPGTPPPPPTTTTPTHTVYTYYRELGTNNTLAQRTTQTVAEGKGWSTSAKDITGYTYHSNSTGNSDRTVTGTMGKSDVTVIFYYTANSTQPTNVTLTIEHRELGSSVLLGSESLTVPKGSQQTASASQFSGYVYVRNSEGNNNRTVTVTMDSNKTVVFWYEKEVARYTVTAIYKATDGTQLDSATQTVKVGDHYSTTQKSFTGYRFVRTTGDAPSGTMPNRDVTVTYWYEKEVARYTVTAYYRAVDSNHNLTDPVTQTVKAGSHYSTDQKSFPGYRFQYVTGDATSGTMPNRNVTVTYWYELEKQEPNGTKDPNAGPGNNGTGNATEGIGPGKGEEDHYIPPTITDTPEQKGDEPTANHRPTDNQGGQAAGSDQRQEIGNKPAEGVIGDNQTTQSSGNGGQDPSHVNVSGATEVDGGGYTPPSKDTPAVNNPGTSTTTTTTDNGNGTSTTTTTTVDIGNTTNTDSLDWEP